MAPALTEASIERAAVKYAASLGIVGHKLVLASNAGWPDRTFLYRGHTLFIEFKKPGGIVSPIQRYTLDQLIKKGFEAYVRDSLEESNSTLRDWKSRVDAREDKS